MAIEKETIPLEPLVIKWIVDSSGWTYEEISKRLKTSVENTEKIVKGEKKLTFRQLKELATVFKRPIAAFLLSEPKPEKPKPNDYRMLPNKTGKFDKKTVLVLREARKLQELCKELSKNVHTETKTQLENFKTSDDFQQIALNYRETLGLTKEKQENFKSAYDFFNFLRDKLEDLNIYVFQFSMPLEDARGFVFVDDSPYVIVVNTKDIIEARLFSLMHEFGHILLGETVIDLPDIILSQENEKEKWCNSFAASFLFPKQLAQSVFDKNKSKLTERTTLNGMSNKYKVSKAVLLLTMRHLNFIGQKAFEDKLNQYKPKPKEKIKQQKKESTGGIPSDKKTVSKVGTKFVSLVANNYDKEFITYTDALNYLSIKSKNFDKVLAKAKK